MCNIFGLVLRSACIWKSTDSNSLAVSKKSDVAEMGIIQRLLIWLCGGSLLCFKMIRRWHSGPGETGSIHQVSSSLFFFPISSWRHHVLSFLGGKKKQKKQNRKQALCSRTNGSERICGSLYHIQAFVHVKQGGSGTGRLLFQFEHIRVDIQ